MSPINYTYAYTVSSKNCSRNNELSLPSLLDYLQETAWQNATNLGFSSLDLLKKNVTWVMNKMVFNLMKMPQHGEKFTIETWPSEINKFFTWRNFRIWSEEKELLIEVRSKWLVMDVVKRKMIPIPEDIIKADFVVDRGELSVAIEKYNTEVVSGEQSVPISVSWFDLDLNDHVSNTKYPQWILDSLGCHFLNVHKLDHFDIEFKIEGKVGDRFVSQCHEVSEGEYLHRLVNLDSDKIHVVAKSKFSKNV